jgi:hypothetical protein
MRGASGHDGIPRTAAEYGCVAGELLGSPGYMRITVAPDNVPMDGVRSCLPEQECDGHKNAEAAFSSTGTVC